MYESREDDRDELEESGRSEEAGEPAETEEAVWGKTDGDEQSRIERTIVNCLRRAASRGWISVALPAISTGLFCVPKEVCAEAFGRAVPRYWQEYPDSSVELIWLCLTIDAYPVFEKVLAERLL